MISHHVYTVLALAHNRPRWRPPARLGKRDCTSSVRAGPMPVDHSRLEPPPPATALLAPPASRRPPRGREPAPAPAPLVISPGDAAELARRHTARFLAPP
jgi:hypothetical protein